MSAKVNLVICLIKVSETGDKFCFVVPLETVPRDDIEDPEGAVAALRAGLFTLAGRLTDLPPEERVGRLREWVALGREGDTQG